MFRGAAVPRRKKPKFEQASSALEELVSTPRVKPKSALETVVERDFEKLVKAINTGYSLSEICATLGKHGISSTPKLLKSALQNFAVTNNRLSELPEKLVPEDDDTDGLQNTQKEVEPSSLVDVEEEFEPDEPESIAEEEFEPDEPSFEELVNQSSTESKHQSGKRSRFNDVELKYN